jgi:hypothetical protein
MTDNKNKTFGIFFSIFFLILFLYVYYQYKNINYNLIYLSLFFFILGIFNSILLTPIRLLWLKIGIMLSKITSPIIMGFIYFLLVVPTGLIMKIFSKKSKRAKSGIKTRWKNVTSKSSMDKQF